ncbi:Ig-like domain-containing protein [Nocardioides ganghwensis]|uniref:Fibronectin type III domain-containing protein n=1 Tax=Nocardioides ganghwensis TaxID=252230 RepID=A0A4Q2SK32_9ACTN|nr:fibronectin type III domain-containing protein [Nocardioides ganghwensis]MBD3944595.1 fibronectin type III domain-containing protein [Nocardioides ganghwensis]RYC04349.1 fibronectin type III domain-containing protein [Nocardioides ganghwensis]
MARVTALRRHRVGIASGVALAVASAAVVAYALSAEGYKKHEAELNDGGVWVVNGKLGWSGRLNKPINQLDGVVPGQDGKARLDVVQDGAAVVTLNRNAARGQSIETSRLEAQDGGSAAVPVNGDVRMAGGTLATADAETGEVWAVRYDSQVGKPLMSVVDRQADPLAEAGEGAALAVGLDGTVVVTSTEERTVTTLAPRDTAFGKPVVADLPGDAGGVSEVTTVGDRIVTLDADAGVVSVVGGATASVPPGSVLQQSGPAYDAVLVGTPEGLLSIDLESGGSTTVSGMTGKPAAPVRLGACVYGAWSGGLGAVAVQCGSQDVNEMDLTGNATTLAFRVNRGEIVLNDANSGTVWDVQEDKPVRIDNWDAFTSKKKKDDDDEENENQSDADRRPPRAKPDSYGVRAGRTTVLHPLDNDSAPEGRLLSIVDVDQPSGGARVEISPDGQTLVLQMPEDARPATFDYYIDDGRNGVSAQAAVDIEVRADGQNESPALREGYEKPTYKVPHGGALSVPVLSDWRDDRDGDTLLLDSAQAVGGEESGARARTTADGRIRFTAPTGDAEGQQQLVRVEFGVTDGRSAPVRKSISFQVQARSDQKAFAPSAEPDVVRGEVGKPIKIRPLLNDLPGSDPNDTDAELVLGGKVPQQPGAKVVSDLESGQLTFTGERAGTYFLSYDAGYGNAPLDQGTVRVDVRPAPKRAAPPVAMPDTLTLYGQAPGIVDVLANDLDPAGGLLTVQRASGDRAGQLDVAIVDGRWLRISAVQPDLLPRTQTVSYTITNGPSSGVRGEVVVTQRPEPEDNTPITVADKVVVRAGAAVSAPVLDNDVSPAGDRLTLLADLVDTDTPGRLDVVAPIDVTGDVGKAFVSGRVVRYVAPDTIKERDTYSITYVAQNLEGKRATGLLEVTVVPADDPNDPPEPPTLEGRVVSGDTIKVRVPGVGVDRNGDPVTVTGVTSAPRLGRIVSYGGNFLEYQAYPRTVGTDEFTYSVVDARGAFATGTARVAVVKPGQPQPPLAVEDRLTVEPGRTATFDPLANDFIAPGDAAEVELLDAPDGVTHDEETNLVSVPAPDSLEAPPVVIVYSVSNGLSESRATMTLQTTSSFNNPPVVYDAFGRADDSGSVLVDVLEGAYDPDGPAEALEVTEVGAGATVVDGVEVRADRGAAPKVLPFVVEDSEGASSAAAVYIPPTGNGLPYVPDGTLIELDAGETTTGKLADYVEAPGDAEVRLASGRRSWSASPSALQAGPDGERGFTLSAAPDFRGPGAVLVEVTSAEDASGNEDTSTTADGATVLLSIPVQVGDDKPTLECPDSVVPIAAGQRYDLDIATFCKVFTVDPRDAAGLTYDAGWSQDLAGVDVGDAAGSVVAITASDSATQGGEAVLAVRAGDSNTEEVRFRLAQAPPPTMLPIKVETMEAGQTRTFDVGAYLQAGVADPSPNIVSVENIGNPGVRASADGSRLTLTAAKDTRGVQADFRLVVSDVSSADPPPERRADARIQFQVIGTPSQPGEPRPYPVSDEVGTIKMSWKPPDDDGGAPITHYVVREERKGATQRCATNECVFRKLDAAGNYSFRVQAVNRVGASEWSELSRSARADTAPGRVQNIRMKSRGDGTITVAWDKPATNTSRILSYSVTWVGGGATEVPGDETEFTATGLNNNEKYVFTIRARNRIEYSLPRSSTEFQPLGTPPAPAAPTVTDLQSGANQTDVRIGWQAVQAEGPGPAVYTVTYTNGQTSGTVPGCQRLASLTCTHSGLPYDGLTYTYRVVATNQPEGEPGNRSAPSEGGSVALVGRPAGWSDWSVAPTGVSQEVQLTFTVPDSRGSVSNVDVLVGGVVARPLPNTTGTVTTKVSMPSNEQAYNVELRVCNEKAPAGCTLSGAKQAQSYGPLGNALTEIRPVVNGKNIYWVITGTANGAPVSVRYDLDSDAEQPVTTQPGVTGQFSVQTKTYTTASFNQDVRLSVVVFDPVRSGRGEDEGENRTKSGLPPAPTVSIARGQACGDGLNTTRACKTSPSQPACLVNSCSTIRLATEGFLENYNCSVDGAVLNPTSGNPGLQNSNHPGSGIETEWYAPGGTVTVTCTDTTGLQTNTSTVSWEVSNN